MAFVPAPNIVQIEVRATKQGEQIENRMYFNCFHEPTTTDLAQLAAATFTVLRSHWLPLMPTDVILREVFLKSLHDENAVEIAVGALVTDVGSFTGTPAANQNTVCISLRSGNSGRSARGRLYWLGLAEEQYTINTMLTTARDDIIAAVEEMRSFHLSFGYQWSIVSYITGGAPRVGGPVYFNVTNVLVTDDVLDSQRRRMPGRGN